MYIRRLQIVAGVQMLTALSRVQMLTALLTALSPELANSTLSRTRQQHLHPSHNLQSPYVHSYPRTTGFLSLYYTYFAPWPHPSSKCTSHHTQVPCPSTKCTHTAQLRSDWWWRWRRNVSFSLCISISLLRPYTFLSRSPLVNKTLFDNFFEQKVAQPPLKSQLEEGELHFCQWKNFLALY